MTMIEQAQTKIIPRLTLDNVPFTELLHHWIEDGKERFALSRVAYSIVPTPSNKRMQTEAFIKRRQMT